MPCDCGTPWTFLFQIMRKRRLRCASTFCKHLYSLFSVAVWSNIHQKPQVKHHDRLKQRKRGFFVPNLILFSFGYTFPIFSIHVDIPYRIYRITNTKKMSLYLCIYMNMYVYMYVCMCMFLYKTLISVMHSPELQKKKSPGSATITNRSPSQIPRGRENRQNQTSANRTNARKALRLTLSSPSVLIAMLKGPKNTRTKQHQANLKTNRLEE